MYQGSADSGKYREGTSFEIQTWKIRRAEGHILEVEGAC
jgi:hypothetical protein